MAVLPPQPRDPGFPPRHDMTFGEVVSSYNMFGNLAAKRHSHMTFHQHTHVSDREATVRDKVVNLRDSQKDPLKSWSTSSRPSLTPRLSARSRTPSPWQPSRRHRSLPSTPRALTPNPLRWSDGSLGGRASSPGLLGYRGYAYADRAADTFTAETWGADSFAAGGGAVAAAFGECPSPQSPPPRHDRGRYGSSRENALAAADPRPMGSPSRWRGAVASSSLDGFHREGRAMSSTAYSGSKMSSRPGERFQHQAGRHNTCSMGPAYTRGELEPPAGEKDMGTWTARIYTKEQQQRLQIDEFGAPALRSGEPPRTPPTPHRGGSTELRGSGQRPGLAAAAEASVGDPRSASFVRLNSFLLRTHITSLVSALAEDGWLEAWEKERLCAQAREDSPTWVNAFFRVYMRFVESEDVRSFVGSLRSQIM